VEGAWPSSSNSLAHDQQAEHYVESSIPNFLDF
jgi:hypothetical protein